MPLYEYLCNSCGNRYEKIQKADEQPDIACPKCGGEVERPLTTPAFQFKGSGWYINDYAKSGSKPSGSDKSSTSESTSGSTSESKPASDSSTKASESKPSSSGSASS